MPQTWGTDWSCPTRGNPWPRTVSYPEGTVRCERSLVSLRKKQRVREGKALALGHTARIQWDKDSNHICLIHSQCTSRHQKDNDRHCPILCSFTEWRK